MVSQQQNKYRIEYVKQGKWVSVFQTSIEDKKTFKVIANSNEFQYRILCNEKDVTKAYRFRRTK